MNQLNQYIFDIYHYLLNLRDTLEFTLLRDHKKDAYTQRKNVLTNGIQTNSPLKNFLDSNKEQGDKIKSKLEEFLKEIYGDDSTVIVASCDPVRVDHTQHIKIYDYVVGLTESIRDIIYGYFNFAKGKNEEDKDLIELLNLDDRLYRSILAMLVMVDFEKSFAEFQKVMSESQGKPTPQSNFIVQNEILKYSSFLRFSRDHHRCTDNETLEILDEVNAIIEMTEGRRDRKDNKSFKELFDTINKKLNVNVGKVELLWKEKFNSVFKTFIEAQQKAKEEAANKTEA